MNEHSLWSSQGIAHAVIIARITERSDAECIDAYHILFKLGALPPDVRLLITKRVDRLRNTEKVLAEVESRMLARLEKLPMSDELRACALEMHALAVECVVRTTNKLFPDHGNN